MAPGGIKDQPPRRFGANGKFARPDAAIIAHNQGSKGGLGGGKRNLVVLRAPVSAAIRTLFFESFSAIPY
jgi:hypothetical protein